MKPIESTVPYIISINTLLLQTVQKESSLSTLVIERDNKFTHPRKALHIIRASCNHYGTSLKLATHTAKNILMDRQKVPIVIAYDRGLPLIMIPILSQTSDQNTWIAFHAITNFYSKEDGYTMVELENRYTVKIASSESTIRRQIALAYLLKRDYQSKFYQFNNPTNPY